MTILVRKALVVDPRSPLHDSIQDIFISNGVITNIGDKIDAEADQVVEANGLAVSPGWIDLFAHFNDPGNEQKETLETGAAAAAAGGYTRVCVVPNTQPMVDSKAQVEYLVQKSRELPIQVLPLGAITKGISGTALSEMYDMRQAGAVAFSDGTTPVQSAGLLLKALQYVKAFDGLLIQLPVDKSLSVGLMHEGITSTRLGLPGIPALAEELVIKRELDLLQYTGSRLHFTGVSTARSIELIREAKQEGLQVSCSVAPYHLVFSDEDLVSYDTNLKVSPPLRSKADVAALRKAVVDGIVDCIATHHFPQHTDNKVCEFEYAKDGMIGLESCFGLVNTAIPELSHQRLAELFSLNAASLLGIGAASIEKGAAAELTLFNRNESYVFSREQIRSRSINSAVVGMQLSGKVIGIINKGKLFLN